MGLWLKSKLQKRRAFWKVAILVVLLLFIVASFFVARFYNSPEKKLEIKKEDLPTPTAVASGQAVDNLQPTTGNRLPTSIPQELNLDVPFTSQAPKGVWDKAHEEACEEAAVLMAKRYFANQKFSSADDAENGLQEIIVWEMRNFGFFESTTAEQTAKVAEGLNLKTQIIDNPTIEEIKNVLSENKLVIVPEAGRELGNPFYTSPGPVYHMLLIKGYTETQFITNDAGTKRGENYPYVFKTVLDANHDWNVDNIDNGAKKIIVVSN